ncbi:helix-turn-helix domain-containing protein [Mycolicibacterium septicum]|uniref:helix-turn-helix domain-containing protein n=1 Tax=Mycolicibacterium septicum TaxID=98668 RepID=UPI0023E0DEA1|nr:helix-turn-helix domain-containing protein [Mycolicibacterium septicum]MDF3342100.1 helix-turn-helix domain-containing protein [Mycolicibacterium septicum]
MQSNSPPSAAEELIDTTAAAAILHCSTQWVRRISDQLDGRNIGCRWLFPRQTVVEYAERKAGQHK